MDTQMNQMPQQHAVPTEQPGMPKRNGYGAVIGIVVLILLILAAFIFWPKEGTEATPASTATTQTEQNSTQAAQAEDLNSLQADLEATNVDGVSDGL